jgi:hypothetical protein
MIDVLIVKNKQPRAVVSCKWSIRHDRISDPTNECTSYKAAAVQRNLPFDYFVATNEFDAARLQKVLGQHCVDGMVHVHEPLLAAVSGPASVPVLKHPKFRDLTTFVNLTNSL